MFESASQMRQTDSFHSKKLPANNKAIDGDFDVKSFKKEITDELGFGLHYEKETRYALFFSAQKPPFPIVKVAPTQAQIPFLENEALLLALCRHESIVRMLGYPKKNCLVLENLGSAGNLLEVLEKKLSATQNGAQSLPSIGFFLASRLLEVANALQYLHKHEILHLDIKPENILITEAGKAVIIDFGGSVSKLAKDNSEAANKKSIKKMVHFTPFYTHPDLSRVLNNAAIEEGVAFVDIQELQKGYDLYSFGKTILRVLYAIESKFPDVIIYDYFFNYLHLLAVRLLDGKNLTDEQQENLIKKNPSLPLFRETWMNLQNDEIAELSIKSAKELVLGLEKLLYPEKILGYVPEVDSTSFSTISAAQFAPVAFTQRLKAIIRHPVFSRLRLVPQLELMDMIFPTANHNRFEHSLGVYANACAYIRHLFLDPHNPLFRAIVSEADLKAVLLAGLLHDLGQHPFGHTLEEARSGLHHENITLAFLKNPTKDAKGFTIKEIIEKEEFWGIDMQRVINLLDINRKNQSHDLFGRLYLKENLLSSIIDGPIDCDKLDYLIRDSARCQLPYGAGIDRDRLIRNLTSIMMRGENGVLKLFIGTYEKGRNAAESISFVRYMMYQSVYWHHSSRAMRCMVREVVRTLNLKGNKRLDNELEKFLGTDGKPAPVDIEAMMSFLWERSDQGGKEFLSMIQSRNYYKRLVVFHSSSDLLSKTEIQKFQKVAGLNEFQNQLQRQIRDRYGAFLSASHSPVVSLLSPEVTSMVLKELSKSRRIICDAPHPSIGSREKLYFSAEPKMVHHNYVNSHNLMRRVSDVWENIHADLMGYAARPTVFCHPQIRDSLMASLGPVGIANLVSELLKKF